MNYKSINAAILSGNDIPKSLKKDKEFYDYLLGNNVAYYYATKLATEKNQLDKKIIEIGERLNNKYYQTLKLINKVCRENGIQFLLFKTYKYIPEVVDNDIDLLIKKKDFHSFLKVLEKEGFDSIENEPLKGICKKNGFCTIEPRVESSFHGLTILNEEQLWKGIENVDIGGIEFAKPLKEVEIMHLLLSLLYNPNYLRLYLLIIYQNSDHQKINMLDLKEYIKADLEIITEDLTVQKIEDKRFPLFIGDRKFIGWWYKRILINSKLEFSVKVKHVLYFFYLKYSYILFNRLIFKHDWFLE